MLLNIYKTRRYPWGIQRLVSTYSNCNPVLGSQNSKCQDLPKFLLGGGGVFCSSQNSKCQDLLKCKFSGGGAWWRVFCSSQTQSANIYLNFNFQGGEGYSCQVKTQSANICLNFNFWVGGGGYSCQVKTQVPRSDQLFIWGEGGYSWPGKKE